MRGLSLVAASGGHSSSRCAGSLVAEHRLQTRRLSNCGSRGLVAPRHVGSSQTRARTRVPCIGRQILNHCATREAPSLPFLMSSLDTMSLMGPLKAGEDIHQSTKIENKGNNKKLREILSQEKNYIYWASLVAQWLRICLLMQGTWV